ncbi:sensor histidine kinase [Sediminispirochaeta bajacaliforniensis]|uniref:sensor histidine kinase n=1 Tax=Sediminispirochaeta bajacaliforniensis TaxID=148 RepID=UPI000365CD7E|nr:histidine kinase dimerization/phosphoacceptor domain -containing protein [Sediminispirochaeta bajacaliforniensis]
MRRLKQGTRFGGLGKIMFLPFFLLLFLGLMSSWALYLSSAHRVVAELIDQVARDTAQTTIRELQDLFEYARTITIVNASNFSFLENNAEIDSFSFQNTFYHQLLSADSLAIIALAFSDGEYMEAQRLGPNNLRIGRAGKQTNGSLEFYRIDEEGKMEFTNMISDYDPRQRPWYKNAQSAGHQVWSRPYSLYSSEVPAISSAIPFQGKDGRKGVVATAVTFDGLSTFLSSALDAKKGYIEVIDDTGKTIASSAPKEEGGTHTEKKTIIIQQTLNMSSFPEWRVRVFLNESAFTTPLKKADQKTVIVLIFLLLLFTFVSGIIISAVTKPIRELEQIVRHIDPANPQVSREIFKIARQKGEIASLAESFFNMAIRIKKNYGELQQNLREKELLLQEVHHRVKNNLQIISSLLCLQADEVNDLSDRYTIIQCQRRIQTMAYVHEAAYATRTYTEIEIGDYLRMICGSVGAHHITLSAEPEGQRLPLDKAIPCGLIVNELISLMIGRYEKHREKAKIEVSFTRNSDTYILSVWDKTAPHSTLSKSGTLSRDLIKSLASQLRGTMTSNQEEGVQFIVIFPA